MQRSGLDKLDRFICRYTSLTRIQNLDYNVPHGKLNRGLSVVDTVEILMGRPLDETEYFKAATLGWCVELVSYFWRSLVSEIQADYTSSYKQCSSFRTT
jgi:farnesyl diphosphate synthase